MKFEERGSVTKWSEFGPPTESTHKVTREDIVFHVGIRSRHWAHLWWTLCRHIKSQSGSHKFNAQSASKSTLSKAFASAKPVIPNPSS